MTPNFMVGSQIRLDKHSVALVWESLLWESLVWERLLGEELSEG